MVIRAIVDANGEVYYSGRDIIKALSKEAKNLVMIDNNLIMYVRRFILKLITARSV
jgi:hypothetical protein